MKLIGIIVGIIIVIAVFILIKGKNKPIIPTKNVDILGLEDILTFFKRPEINNILKQNTNLIAVAIREMGKDGNINITAALFDKEKNSVADIEKHATAWNAKQLDDRLSKTFGDKEMIIIQ